MFAWWGVWSRVAELFCSTQDGSDLGSFHDFVYRVDEMNWRVVKMYLIKILKFTAIMESCFILMKRGLQANVIIVFYDFYIRGTFKNFVNLRVSFTDIGFYHIF